MRYAESSSVMFPLGLTLLLVFVLSVASKRKLTPEVERILAVKHAEMLVEVAKTGKKFKLAACFYCGATFRTKEEAVAHWLEKRGKCAPPPEATNVRVSGT